MPASTHVAVYLQCLCLGGFLQVNDMVLENPDRVFWFLPVNVRVVFDCMLPTDASLKCVIMKSA